MIIKLCNCGGCGKEFNCDELTPVSDGLALCQSCLSTLKEN